MSSFLTRYTAIMASLFCMAQTALAAEHRTLDVGTGTTLTFWQVAGNIMSFLTAAIGAVAMAMFVVGALLITVSGIKEDYRQRGKDFIIGSVLSMAVVGGAYAMLRVVDFFLTN